MSKEEKSDVRAGDEADSNILRKEKRERGGEQRMEGERRWRERGGEQRMEGERRRGSMCESRPSSVHLCCHLFDGLRSRTTFTLRGPPHMTRCPLAAYNLIFCRRAWQPSPHSYNSKPPSEHGGR